MTSAESCFHCGLPIPAQAHYLVEIDQQSRAMCCAGCQAVAQAIVDHDLNDFYRYRTENGYKAEALVPEALRELQVYDNPEMQRTFVSGDQAHEREAALILEGIVCAACVWLNEQHVQQLPGVKSFQVNYATHRARLIWDDTQIKLSEVLAAIQAIGYHAHPFDPNRLERLHQQEKSAALRRIAVAGLGMMQVMMVSAALYIGVGDTMSANIEYYLRWVSLLMALPVILYSAQVFFTSAWRDLKRRRFGMDVPVSLALGIAFSASVWATLTQTGEIYFDSVVMFTFFLLTGRYLEMAARHKAGQVADELVRLLPVTATRVQGDLQQVVAVSELQAQDHVLVKPGEIIPVDGVLLQGSGSVNESLLSGESLPCDKQVGDWLVSGTVNNDAPLVMQVDKVGDQTTLAAIVRLLERAQSEKPALARLAERVAARFVPLILLTAAVVYAVWLQIDASQAFWVALSVLVITCPCAFSLATPAALTAATGALTGQGVLTTRGHALETLAQVDHMVFDKTGTLTTGQLRLKNIHSLADMPKAECHALAAGLESVSEHPVAKALSQGVDALPLTSIQNHPGQGLSGDWQGKRYYLGSLVFVQQYVAMSDQALQSLVSGSVSTYGSQVYLADAQRLLAVFQVNDTLRPEAKALIEALRSMNIYVSLLSGDRYVAVKQVAEQLAIDDFAAEQLPEDKLAAVKTLQAQGKTVAMVGDGLNDAPVLTAAQVSIAMGQGTQLAQASADMILLSDDIRRIAQAVKTARDTQKVIKQNFAWTILYNVCAIPVAAMGAVIPWMAALGMSISSLVVVLNALRLR